MVSSTPASAHPSLNIIASTQLTDTHAFIHCTLTPEHQAPTRKRLRWSVSIPGGTCLVIQSPIFASAEEIQEVGLVHLGLRAQHLHHQIP